MDPIDDTPVSALPSPAALALRERLNRLQQVGLEKRASLNKVTPQEQMLQELEQDRHTKTTAELRAMYGDGLAIMADNANRLEAQQEINRTRGRTLSELVVDNPLAMARTGVTMTGGGVALSDRLNRLGGPGAVTDRLLSSGLFGEETAKRYVENRTRASMAVVKATSAVDAALGRRMSSASQASDQYVNAQIAASQQKNRAAYDLAVADGESPWLAGAKRIGSDLGDAVKATASDGTTLSNLVVGQVPTLGIGLGARAAVTAEGVAARAALLAEREAVRGGMGTFGVTAARVTPALEAKAAEQLATRNLVVGTGLSEGAGGYQQAAGEIAAMSPAELAEAFPEYAERLRTEINPEAVRDEIMGKVGMRTAVLQGIAAGGISRIASRFELSPLTSGLSSTKKAASRLGANAANVLQEGAEETLQSGSGQLASNVANLAVGRQDVDWAGGVGTAAGQGLVGGIGMAGALQAPSAAGNAALAAGSLALDGVGKGALWAAAKIKARGENVRKAMKGEADKDFLGAVEAQAAVAAATPDILKQAGPAAEAADFSLKPSDNVPEGLVTPTEGEPVTNKLQAQASAIFQLATQPDMDNERRLQLKVFVAHNARETQDQIGQVLQPALDAATDDATREQLATAIQHLSLFTDGDEVQQIRAELADLPQAQIDQTLESLPKDLIDPATELPGVLQSTINLIDELVLAAPSRLSAEQLDRVMLQRSHMRPAQRARLDAALAYARSRANYDEILELTQAAGGTKVKAASVVSDQIQLRGFKEQGGQLVSLDEHFKKVNEAMAANQLSVAEKQFKQLLGWAANAQVRAGALQDQALKQLEAGVDAFVPSSFRSTDDSGALGKETFKVNPFQKQGAGALELIAADANMVAETVDALVAAYPALAEVEYRAKGGTPIKAGDIGRVNRIDFIGMGQQDKTGAAQAAAAGSRLTLALAQAGERRRNVQASLDPDGRVQLVDADEMKRNQKAPAVLRADGKPMTAAQLGRLLSGQSVVDLLTPKEAAPQPTPVVEQVTEQTVEQSTEQPEEAPAKKLTLEERVARNKAALAARPKKPTLEERVVRNKEAVAAWAEMRALREKVEQLEQALQPKPEEAVEDKQDAPVPEQEVAPAREPRPLSERFSGLVATVKDIADAGRAQLLAFSNRFQQIYSSQPDGLFDRLGGGAAVIMQAIDEDRLAELLPENRRYMVRPETDVEALREFFGTRVDEVVASLNKRLNAEMQKKMPAGKFAGRTRLEVFQSGEQPDMWNFLDFTSLHAMQVNEDGTVAYHPEVAEAMALVALRWTLDQRSRPVKPNWEKIDARWGSHHRIPQNIREAYQSGFMLEDAARTLSNELRQVLGLTLKSDIPVTMDSELMLSLSLNALHAAHSRGYFNLISETVPEGFNESKLTPTLHFANFDASRWNQDDERIPNEDLVDVLLTPFRESLPSIGQPHDQKVFKAKGTNQSLSEEQRRVEQVHNAQAFYLNDGLLDVFDKIGWDIFRKLRGYRNDLDQLNRVDRAAKAGLNQSISYQDNHMDRLLQGVKAYALSTGTAPEQVPVHWFHRTLGTNGRVMAQGVAPQNDKLFRELFGMKPRTITKGDPENEQRLFAAVAQALGLAKLEKVGLAAAADKLQEALALPEMQAMLEHLAAPGQEFMSLVQALEAAARNAGLKIEVADTKSVHALYALAQYNKTETGAEFASNLTIEIDGVNNGPHNAHLQFFYGDLSVEDLRQMGQGGVYVGTGKETVLADAGDVGDRYTDVSALTTQLANENRGDLSIPESIRELYGPMLRALEHAGQVTVYDEEQAKAHGRPFEFDRKFGKSVLVPVGYMSGQKAVSAKIASTLLDAFYDEISKALVAKRPVDPRVVARFARLVEGTVNKKGNVFSVGKFTLPTSEEGLRDFRVRDPFVKALVNNINLTLGKDAFTAADTNLKKSRKVLGAVVSLSQLQAAMANELFRTRYEQRRVELIEAGELGKFDGLSKDQEQELLRELKDVLPNVALMHTTEDDPSEGLSAVVRDKGEAFTTKVIARDGASRDRARVVHAFGSKISARVTRMGIGDPGVSMAPLLTIGSGDVSMMHLLKMLQGIPEFLNIWDGIDVHFSQAADMGVAANQAAFETWQNTVLESVLDAANRIDRTLLDTLPAEQMDAVAAQAFSAFDLASAAFKKLHPKVADPTEEKAFWDLYKKFKSSPVETLQGTGLDSRELVNTLFDKTVRQLTYATQERQDAWQAMTELGVSVDQMAGGGRAFVHPGSGEAMSPTEVVDYVNARKAQLKKLRREEAEQAAGTNTRTLREGNLRHLVAPDADQVTLTKEQALQVLLRKNVLPGKVASSMLRMVQKMIPDNVRIILASEEQADSLAESLGMTGLDDWNGVAIPGSEPTVIVRNFSSVTLAHELMHIALSNMLHEYKTRGRKNNTTPLQRNAMDMLEKLAEAFLELDPETAQDYRARDRLALMQQTMQELKDNGDIGGMIDEFIAYSMTEALVQEDLMHRELPSVLRRISSKVREFIRRILGLPANAATDNWLEEVFGQVRTLTYKMQAPYEAIQASPTRGQMSGRLGEVHDRFSALVKMVRPSNEKIPLQTYSLANQVTKATLAFLNKGFDLDADQRRVFMQVQMVFAAGMQMDPETQHALYRSYEHAMKHLTARDLMDDPTSNSLDQIMEGEVRLAALQGVDTTVPNAVGQTNQLANFVALAQVDPVLRNALAKLPPMRGPKEAKNLDDALREATTRIIDTGSDLQVGTLRNKNQLEALDFLVTRMAAEQTRLRDRAAALKRDSVVDMAEGWVKDKMSAGAEKLVAQADALRAGGKEASRKEQIAREGVARLLDGLAATSDSKQADAWTESLVSLLNEGSSFAPVRDVLRELLGTSPSAQQFSKLLNQSKQAVSTVRQRLREETPRQVKKWFKTPLSKQEWQRLSTLVGRTDVAAVWNTVPREALLAALSEPAKLQELIQAREELLGNSSDSARLKEASDDLAHWMVHRHNKAKRLLYRNAEAIAEQHGQRPVGGVAKNIAIIDELVSLRALEKLSADQRQALRLLIEREPEAMDRLVQTLRALGEIEHKKSGGEMANRWKGWVPESSDPRKQVRLATPEQAKELLKMGWERLDSYRGDTAETQLGLAYYASSTATEVAYSQGALQMVLNTAGGTMADTGHTLSPVTGLVISDPTQVGRISMAKRMGKGDPKGENMIPVFQLNEEEGVMEIVAYERTLNAGLVQAHTKGDSDLAVGIGIWMGRQAEEELAGQFNGQLVEQLKEAWDKEQLERGGEYIALNLSKDPIDRDTWQSIPEQTKKLLLERFDGKVMVRRDVRNNAFGHRNMSVRDVFTGISGLKPEVRKMIEDLALGILGKNAYPVLTRIEDAVQGVVGMSKDMIVVRSGVVAVANLVANQFQLLAQGVPLTELPRQLKIAKQIETYLRNEHRLARIQTDLRAATETAEINRLNGEAARLLEENRRLQIYDLVEAGELPTIAEGLSETDEYTLVADGMRWIEEKTAGLPQGIKTFGRYATIAPDTALYQGLNRLIQFGDLMAKQLMYEKLLRDGMTKEAALNYVRDNFVNYNLLPGRTRTALEQMGVLWFWNYKLRIQKIFFRTIRDNPLRALMAFGAAGASGVDSLWSSQAINANLSYSVGYDQLASAHSMNMWWQVFGK